MQNETGNDLYRMSAGMPAVCKADRNRGICECEWKHVQTGCRICEDGMYGSETNADVAVKTEQPIPKERLLEAMKQLNQMTVSLPVSIGDVLALDVFGSRIVACQNRQKG